MKATKTKKKPYSPQKKLLKRKEKVLHQQNKCPDFTNFFRTPEINNSNLSNEKQRT